jgi:hypothetical protein
LGNLFQFNLSFGVFFGQFLSYLLVKISGDETGHDFWIVIFGFSLLTQLLQLAALTFYYNHETPRYLMMEGRKQECMQLLKIIYKD